MTLFTSIKSYIKADKRNMASKATKELTNDERSLDIASGIAYARAKHDLRESQQKQQDTSSDQGCSPIAPKTYLVNVGTGFRMQSLIPTIF